MCKLIYPFVAIVLCGGCVEGVVTDAIWTAITVNGVNFVMDLLSAIAS